MKTTLISAAAVTALGLLAAGCSTAPVPVLHDGLEQVRYNRCTLKPHEEKLYSSNFIGDGILSGYPPGSEVVVTMFSPQRVDMKVNKIPHQMFPVEGEFNAGDPAGFLNKYFVSSLAEIGLAGNGAGEEDASGNPLADPTQPVPEGGDGDHNDVETGGDDTPENPGFRLDLMKKTTAQSVKSGIAAVGMTKEQVYMSYGPPTFINFDTPAVALDLQTILEANRWIYYSSWAGKTFTVGLAGKKVYTFDGTHLIQVQ